MRSDSKWLERWKDLISGKRVLEMGCGDGKDTRILKARAGMLVSCDLNPSSDLCDISKVMVVDHKNPLPFRSSVFEVVVASLTLHYFRWMVTISIFKEISNVLTDHGILICRLNSREDINFGATGHPEIEPGLFNVHGRLKRFFERHDIEVLFKHGWKIIHLEHK
jgi:SAM-dependent methyltransferase